MKNLMNLMARMFSISSLLLVLGYPHAGLCIEQGQALPGLESFDRAILETIAKWDIPGASLAVAKDGRLVLSKGYGYADKEKQESVTPQTLFRMGSINKTLTAVTVLRLVEQKKVQLDDLALPILAKLSLVPAILGDARAKEITVRHLLQHTAGMDRNISGDPFFQPKLRDVARRQNSEPVTCDAIIRDTLQNRLDFAPGERFAYSNTGYCMLGKVIETVTGESYATYASEKVLQPAIGTNFRAGKSTESYPGESKYYPYPGEPAQRGAPGVSTWSVPTPYGSYSIENMDALGAWIATPTDMLKFFLAIDGARGTRLLTPESIVAMRSQPAYPQPPAARIHYGLGIEVVRGGATENWFHGGSQPGVQTLALRTGQGYSWVVAFNSRPDTSKRPTFFSDFDRALWNAARAVQLWPNGDLF